MGRIILNPAGKSLQDFLLSAHRIAGASSIENQNLTLTLRRQSSLPETERLFPRRSPIQSKPV
ncbi:hypothetical protein, partial [Aedoeadaptatus coxii]|uniref:hypothetical protein n=1 Tax=Aedoeadaptatus coxii TaxID=755172 RepID=UPI001E659544